MVNPIDVGFAVMLSWFTIVQNAAFRYRYRKRNLKSLVIGE
jgi:uncharacterized membrane protein